MKRKVNSISDAIDELCEYSFNLDSPIGITDETARLARIALREQEERGKGCEYCTVNKELAETLQVDTLCAAFTKHTSEMKCLCRPLRYCPMCGRKLDGGGQDARKGVADATALIESLQAQLTASQRRAQDARNELCQRCGRYKEAHKGACDGCRWRKEK